MISRSYNFFCSFLDNFNLRSSHISLIEQKISKNYVPSKAINMRHMMNKRRIKLELFTFFLFEKLNLVTKKLIFVFSADENSISKYSYVIYFALGNLMDKTTLYVENFDLLIILNNYKVVLNLNLIISAIRKLFYNPNFFSLFVHTEDLMVRFIFSEEEVFRIVSQLLYI